MPQDVKIHPSNADDMELAPAAAREQLEGWVPPLVTDDELRAALEKAFDYRGDVTITQKDGSRIEGYVFDRRSSATTLAGCFVRLMPKDRNEKVAISYGDIQRLEFTGRDTAAGKSWETWVRKYQEKKGAGEKDIRLEPEKLE